jgi:hypothetical protein
MAISFSRESSSADNPPRVSCSASGTVLIFFLGPTAFEDGLEGTIPLEAVVRDAKVKFAFDCTTEPDRKDPMSCST